MWQSSPHSLWNILEANRALIGRFVRGAESDVTWSHLVAGTVLSGRGNEFRGRSVVVATTSQLTAFATLIELDGVASRIILYPPDLSLDHLPFVAHSAAVDAIVSDRTTPGNGLPGVAYFTPPARMITSGNLGSPSDFDRGAQCETEWVLLTSGTTGRPKLVVDTLASLAGAIAEGHLPTDRVARLLTASISFRRNTSLLKRSSLLRCLDFQQLLGFGFHGGKHEVSRQIEAKSGEEALSRILPLRRSGWRHVSVEG